MPDLREKRVELILQQLEELPALPAVALRVLQVTAGDSSAANEVVQLIASDPALTARILQLVRRADLDAGHGLDSIEHAVLLFGFDALRAAVLAISVFQTFGPRREEQPSDGRVDREAFWKHGLAVGCCAELLVEAADATSSGHAQAIGSAEAFVCGLLHDIGKIALDAVLPKSFSRVVEATNLLRGNIADIERSVLGMDHMVVGKRLAERWQLPTAIRDCAWLHGQLPLALPATVKQPRLVSVVTLADQLVRERHLGYSGNYTFSVPHDALLESVGLSEAQAESALSRLMARIEPRAAALGLNETSSDELYRQALAQANVELTRVSAQLTAKTRRLSERSRFFDALGQFQSTLRPDATPQAVMQAVARTAVGVLSVARVATFSLPPGQDYAEALVCDETGHTIDASLIDLPGMSQVTQDATIAHATAMEPSERTTTTPLQPLDSKTSESWQEAPAAIQRPPEPTPGDGPVLPAGEGLEWLVGALSPRLPHDRRFWICLEADGALIGGVVWGAPTGEAQRLSPQAQELCALANGWGLALRTAQIREEARTLAEQLADANRRLYDAQAEILRSRALLSLGEMAAGAAHEMNNPLAVISGRSQLLARELTDPKQRASAHLIAEQADRLSGIITEMMDFARPEPPRIQTCELKNLMHLALADAKARNDSTDRVIEVVLGDMPAITVDENQVAAALAEVIDNALHATEGHRGQVSISAAFDPYSSRVVITVTDDGCGMEDATLKRAFDPFYSNKTAGRRRGLGLAKALRWIEASGGSIRLESRPAQGTRAVILLPAATAAADASAALEHEAAT